MSRKISQHMNSSQFSATISPKSFTPKLNTGYQNSLYASGRIEYEQSNQQQQPLNQTSQPQVQSYQQQYNQPQQNNYNDQQQYNQNQQLSMSQPLQQSQPTQNYTTVFEQQQTPQQQPPQQQHMCTEQCPHCGCKFSSPRSSGYKPSSPTLSQPINQYIRQEAPQNLNQSMSSSQKLSPSSKQPYLQQDDLKQSGQLPTYAEIDQSGKQEPVSHKNSNKFGITAQPQELAQTSTFVTYVGRNTFAKNKFLRPLAEPEFEYLYSDFAKATDKEGCLRQIAGNVTFSVGQFSNLMHLIKDENQRVKFCNEFKYHIYQLQDNLDQFCTLFQNKINSYKFRKSFNVK